MRMQVRSGGASIPLTTDSNGNDAGNMVAEITAPVGQLETRTVTFNATADMPADNSAVTVAELIKLNTFVAGKKRCRLTYHNSTNEIPFASTVVVTLNADDDVNAASRLSIADVSEGGTGALNTRQRFLSAQNPVIEYDLSRQTNDISRLDMVGTPPAGTAASTVYISVEVW